MLSKSLFSITRASASVAFASLSMLETPASDLRFYDLVLSRARCKRVQTVVWFDQTDEVDPQREITAVFLRSHNLGTTSVILLGCYRRLLVWSGKGLTKDRARVAVCFIIIAECICRKIDGTRIVSDHLRGRTRSFRT